MIAVGVELYGNSAGQFHLNDAALRRRPIYKHWWIARWGIKVDSVDQKLQKKWDLWTIIAEHIALGTTVP